MRKGRMISDHASQQKCNTKTNEIGYKAIQNIGEQVAKWVSSSSKSSLIWGHWHRWQSKIISCRTMSVQWKQHRCLRNAAQGHLLKRTHFVLHRIARNSPINRANMTLIISNTVSFICNFAADKSSPFVELHWFLTLFAMFSCGINLFFFIEYLKLFVVLTIFWRPHIRFLFVFLYIELRKLLNLTL